MKSWTWRQGIKQSVTVAYNQVQIVLSDLDQLQILKMKFWRLLFKAFQILTFKTLFVIIGTQSVKMVWTLN